MAEKRRAHKSSKESKHGPREFVEQGEGAAKIELVLKGDTMGSVEAISALLANLKVPSADVMPRDGSLALASVGRVRKVQVTAFAVAAGRKSFALKRILEVVVESPGARAMRGSLTPDVLLARAFAMRSVIIRSFS